MTFRNIVNYLLFPLICLLFISVGVNQMVYPLLYAAASVSFILLLLSVKNIDFHKKFLESLIPVFLLIYIGFTPGYWFKDLPVASMMLASYVIGLAAACLLRKKIHWLYLCLSLTLSFTFLYCLVMNYPSQTMKSGKLHLFFYHNSVMALVTAWCVGYLYFNRKKFIGYWHYILWTTISLNLCIFAMSGGRSAYLGCICSTLTIGIIQYRKHLKKIFILLFTFFLCTYIALPDVQKDRIRSVIQNPIQDNTFQSRLPIWEVAIDGIINSPLWGNSLRNFYNYDKQYKEKNLEEMKTRYSIIENSAIHPHNIYLGILFMSGIAGGILWLLTYVPAITMAIKQNDVFFLFFLFFFLTYGLFDFSLHRKDGAITLFFPLGVVYGHSLLNSIRCLQNAEKLPAAQLE